MTERQRASGRRVAEGSDPWLLWGEGRQKKGDVVAFGEGGGLLLTSSFPGEFGSGR